MFWWYATKNKQPNNIMIGFINIQSQPKSGTQHNNFDLTNLIIESNFDPTVLTETSIYRSALKDYDTHPLSLGRTS